MAIEQLNRQKSEKNQASIPPLFNAFNLIFSQYFPHPIVPDVNPATPQTLPQILNKPPDFEPIGHNTLPQEKLISLDDSDLSLGQEPYLLNEYTPRKPILSFRFDIKAPANKKPLKIEAGICDNEGYFLEGETPPYSTIIKINEVTISSTPFATQGYCTDGQNGNITRYKELVVNVPPNILLPAHFNNGLSLPLFLIFTDKHLPLKRIIKPVDTGFSIAIDGYEIKPTVSNPTLMRKLGSTIWEKTMSHQNQNTAHK